MSRPYLHFASLLAAACVLASATSAQAATWPDESSTRAWPPSNGSLSDGHGSNWHDYDAHGYRWYEFNGFPVPAEAFPVRLVHLGEPPAGMSVAEVERVAENAARAWSSVSCASAQVVYAGRRASLDELAPEEVPFYFAVPALTPCFPEQTIGWTALTCGGGFPDKTIFLNTNIYDWSAEPEPFQPAHADPQSDARLVVDFESVLVHEVGHVLGLSHSSDRLATMFASYRGDGGQRSLAVDDKLGLCSLYTVANPPDECASGRDCADDERCERVEELALCRERRGAPGDPCALDRLICEEVCVLPRNEERFGYCTTACDSASDCPSDFECTEGLLAAQERHCERTAALEDSSCSAAGPLRSGGRSPSPVQLIWVVVLAAVWRLGGIERLSRARGSR